ncbi:RNA polymerase sigma factor [Nannocystis pusilla]|uniref:RNA polymerase sigma factor n=1 Tax=Nannocystis pusilla TaxID=889268 RepID=UPI003B76C5CB
MRLSRASGDNTEAGDRHALRTRGQRAKRAFRELYRNEFTFVWTVARRLGVPPPLVEDAVQDVFLTAYRRLDQVCFEVSARAWLYGVTRRIASRYHRSAERRSRRLAAIAAVSHGPADPPQERVDSAEQLERLLAQLGANTRAAFEMSELFGMSGPEIASELGIPVKTVYSRVRLAREQLIREFGEARLEREFAGARERDAPPPAAAQRSWAALAPGLMSTHAGVGLATLVTARAAVMTTLVLAAGVVAVAGSRPPGPFGPALPRPTPHRSQRASPSGLPRPSSSNRSRPRRRRPSPRPPSPRRGWRMPTAWPPRSRCWSAPRPSSRAATSRQCGPASRSTRAASPSAPSATCAASLRSSSCAATAGGTRPPLGQPRWSSRTRARRRAAVRRLFVPRVRRIVRGGDWQ